ncbi:MAG: hypothetical protein ACR5KV_02100 [Wolbachia sp.]
MLCTGMNDKEFFKKVKEENENIKLSKIPREYSPELEKIETRRTES